ncbi:hypothetical protein [Pyrobaculum neutrophilum]|uniref:Uncharacterized protein n=1 Tax=Pyrobaculum neutrophilum (strain DSM 2338 / JCM 9278 / NBRC 100436 / V24Sta) TaxID=444157 RepID=B1YCK0_PYRNV|nr:hypothetical protein [Pyrobaculum neutrophilum]ACB39513.1 conserved hypothetical protein [Pyrobaculum neutrophilum V24Sta]
MLVVLPCEKLAELAARLGCPEAPKHVDDTTKCGRYALYLNYVEEKCAGWSSKAAGEAGEGRMCYVGITLSDLWIEDWGYRSYEAAPYAAEEAEKLLEKVADIANMAVATRAPSVRADTGDLVYRHMLWVWVRRGWETCGKAREIAAYVALKTPQDTYWLYSDSMLHGEEKYGGTLIKLR